MDDQRLIRQFDRRTGKTYVYTEEKITDPETAQVRVKRHIVGRLAEDGSIVPTGRRGRPKKEYDGSSDQDRYDALLQQLRQKDAQLQMLRNSLRDAVRANEEMMTMLQRQNERLNRLLDEE